MRKIIQILGVALGGGTFLLSHASKISNYIGIITLPSDLKDALIMLSTIPTLVSWGVLALGLFCAGYLIHDSGHHTLAMAAIKNRVPRLELSHAIILGLTIAALAVGLQLYRGPQKITVTKTVSDPAQQAEIDRLKRDLASRPTGATPPAVTPLSDDEKQALKKLLPDLSATLNKGAASIAKRMQRALYLSDLQGLNEALADKGNLSPLRESFDQLISALKDTNSSLGDFFVANKFYETQLSSIVTPPKVLETFENKIRTYLSTLNTMDGRFDQSHVGLLIIYRNIDLVPASELIKDWVNKSNASIAAKQKELR